MSIPSTVIATTSPGARRAVGPTSRQVGSSLIAESYLVRPRVVAHTRGVWRWFAVCFVVLGPTQPPFDAPLTAPVSVPDAAASSALPIAPLPATPRTWTFAVLSDIHAPNNGGMWPTITKTVAALVAMRPRA